MLGISNGTDKKATFNRSYADLARSAGAVLYMDARKATGYAPGVNSPLTTDVANMVNRSNHLTLNAFDGTATDGYATAGGKQALVFDGVNSYLTMSDLSDMDITGTQNFGVSAIVQIQTGAGAGYVVCKNDTGYADVRYGLLYEGGIFKVISSGVILISSPAISFDTWLRISAVRDSGILYLILNGVQVASVASPTSLVSATNFRVGCRVNGVSNSAFCKMRLGAVVITKGEKATLKNGTKMMQAISKGYL